MTNGEQPAKKKGLPTIAWVAIGCGGLIVIAFILFAGLGVFAVKKGKEMVAEASGSESFEDFVEDLQENPAKKMAEAMVAMNPELELVATDDEAGTITVVNTETGERATLNFEDLAQGRFSMTTDEGEFRVDASAGDEGGLTVTGPEGETRFGATGDLGDVPAWVPLYPRATETRSLFHTVAQDGVSGIVASQTGDDAQAILDYFVAELEDRGWEITSQSTTKTGDGAYGAISAEGQGRTVNVTVAAQGGDTEVTINYSGSA